MAWPFAATFTKRTLINPMSVQDELFDPTISLDRLPHLKLESQIEGLIHICLASVGRFGKAHVGSVLQSVL